MPPPRFAAGGCLFAPTTCLSPQEKILASCHGVDIGRNILYRWAELAAFWFKPSISTFIGIFSPVIRWERCASDEFPPNFPK
jgi:hypothetical protein